MALNFGAVSVKYQWQWFEMAANPFHHFLLELVIP